MPGPLRQRVRMASVLAMPGVVATNKGLQYEPGPQEPSFIAADAGPLAYNLRRWTHAVVGALCCSEYVTWYGLREPSSCVSVSVTC